MGGRSAVCCLEDKIKITAIAVIFLSILKEVLRDGGERRDAQIILNVLRHAIVAELNGRLSDIILKIIQEGLVV